jgi:hypothetical protein
VVPEEPPLEYFYWLIKHCVENLYTGATVEQQEELDEILKAARMLASEAGVDPDNPWPPKS